MSISSYVQAFSSGHLVFVLSNFIFSCRFVCCVMVAIPLGATLLTAMIRWQWKRKVEPTLESSCLNSALNLYGTLKTSSSSSSETNSWSSEESSKCKVHHLDLLRSSTAYHTYYGYYLQQPNNAIMWATESVITDVFILRQYWPCIILVLADSNHPTQTCALQSRVYGCLQAISIQKTTQGIFSTSTSIPVGGYASLNGIRVLSLLWIICGHSAQFPVINSLGMTVHWWSHYSITHIYFHLCA